MTIGRQVDKPTDEPYYLSANRQWDKSADRLASRIINPATDRTAGVPTG